MDFSYLISILFFFSYFLICLASLQVPVGRATLGRIINVIGEPIDERGEISKIPHITLYLSVQKLLLCDFSIVVLLTNLLLISVETEHSLPIHREAPAFVEQATEQQILVTGIKVFFFFCFMIYIFVSPCLHWLGMVYNN